ncbi:VG15 protein [Paractinoplanes rishiriensis]|uniref:Uncharacterized protein n=1 Tax=Paractinoplanes rishiriensis TaxID=1050105 RepID=A0A919N010_9ACTN|nr:hypothetical protein [Actinoplanes rishiriensis]GIF02219.1 hypothetical protein Ari01nite_96830 [Actinoplanes rishiriensis]
MSAARDAEAETASTAYQVALARLGVATVADALALWQHLPAQRAPAVTAAWLRAAVRIVMTRRGHARDLAMAYYRLVRALRTGRTIADPYHPDPAQVTLGMLRREFAALATPATAAPTTAAQPDQATPAPSRTLTEDPEPSDDDADRVLVEEIESLRQEAERRERDAEREAQIILDQLGPALLDRKTRDLDPGAPAGQVDAARRDTHAQAGARQAAAAERIALNGARSTEWATAQSDRRALGYIRVSQSGTPCGWCAMLISRGAVYKTAASAEFSDGDKYHDNCHCVAETIFTPEQLTSARYALNRAYGQQWPQVTAGLSGKAALRAWRRFIRQQQASEAPT